RAPLRSGGKRRGGTQPRTQTRQASRGDAPGACEDLASLAETSADSSPERTAERRALFRTGRTGDHGPAPAKPAPPRRLRTPCHRGRAVFSSDPCESSGTDRRLCRIGRRAQLGQGEVPVTETARQGSGGDRLPSVTAGAVHMKAA